MVEISVSILSIEEQDSIKKFYNLEEAHVDYFHIDVMDGEFVPKNTVELMMKYSESLKHITNIPLDVHLMVKDVKSFVLAYSSINPNIITFHLEAAKDKEEVMELINLLKESNIKVGLAIKPNTPAEDLYEFLPFIHMALIMTVEPGLGGQKLMPEMLDKVENLREYANKNNLDFDIQIDGGVKVENIEMAKKSGVDIAVVGTGITNAENYKKIVKDFKI